MISSSGGFGSVDQHRHETGCPNECLKLQADVVRTCTSLGIIEEDLIKSTHTPPLTVSANVE